MWRDVSRNSQKRRMKATILPPGYIAGNSLGVISNMDESKNKLLFLLLAIMNSMIFEFQARGQLVSNHVSSGVIKQLRIPRLAENEEILTKVDNQMAGQNEEWNIEVLIAKMYGLTKEQFMSVACRYNLSENESAQLQKAINRYY